MATIKNIKSSEEPTIKAALTSYEVMRELWERVSGSLSKSELEWFARATGQAEHELSSLKDVVSGIGCLICNDETSGAFRDQGDSARLLFSISNHLDAIHGLVEIGDSAVDRRDPRRELRRPQSKQGGHKCLNTTSSRLSRS